MADRQQNANSDIVTNFQYCLMVSSKITW